MGLLHLAPLDEVDRHGECLVDMRRRLTFDEFRTSVGACAERLAASGVGRGDVVATVLTNRAELVVAMYAAWTLGASVTPVNPALTDDEIEYQLFDASVKVAVTEASTVSKVGVASIDVDELDDHSAHEDRPWTSPAGDELALIVYTSGTTGRPKGVMLDHANLASMTEMIGDVAGVDATDRALLVLPLFHVNAIMVSAVAPLAFGGSTVIRQRFNPATFWADVEQERPTFFSGVPAVFIALTHLPDDVSADVSSLRMSICGAAPMPPDAIANFEQRYTVPVVEGYGLSESTVALTFNSIEGLRKPGTVGKPIDGVTVSIVDDAGAAVPPGLDGEVVARGPNVMRGYLGKPLETSEALRDGWLHTGDVGHFDADGYLVLVDRKKDLIIRGGENISPSEVEAVLSRHASVAEAAVVGRPHEVMGEEPVAFVIAAPDQTIDPEALRRHCRTQLASFKVPRAVFVVDTLPRNAIGKVLKGPLRDGMSHQEDA